MAHLKLSFFAGEEWEKAYVGKHKELSGADVEVTFFDHILDAAHIPEDTSADAISVFVDSKIDSAVIEKFPNLKLIATRSTGFDHIDLASAKARNIVVSTVPGYGANTVAEHAFGLLLALSKRIYDGYEQVRETGSFDPHALRGFDLLGKTLGVIGTGRIGRHSVQIGKGFGMKVIASDAFPDQAYAKEVGIEYKSLPEVLSESDIITIHVPYMKETHHLINRETLSHAKAGMILINTSRGAVVETAALLEALKSGQVAGAGLDVLEEEGAIKDELNFLISGDPQCENLKTVLSNHVLIDLPNVIVTPHSAFNTKEALERIMDTTIGNIVGFASGEPKNLAESA
ncbi:MAG TPA: NAD(P)-dependent oxidoreductase [Candidatus Paceibacterota bacterium]|jgi:D-lactate dehydrogenase